MTQEVASIGQLTKCAKVTSQEGTRGPRHPGVLGWGMGSGNRKGGGGRGGRDYTIGFPSSRFYIPIGIYPAAIPYSTTRLITYRLFYH